MNEELKSGGRSLAGDFILSVLKFSASTWVNFIIALVTVPITTRLFTPDQAGKIGMFSIAVTLFSIVCLLGLDQSYIRFFREPPENCKTSQLLSLCLTLNLLTFALAVLVLLPFARQILISLFGEYNAWAAVFILLSALDTVVLRYLNVNYRMSQQAGRYAVQNVSITIATKLLYVAAAIFRPSYFCAAALSTAGLTALALIYISVQKDSFAGGTVKLEKSLLKAVLSYGLPWLPVALISWLGGSLSQLMIKGLFDFATLGIYNAALSLASVLSLIQSGFNTYWTAYVYANYKTEQRRIFQVHGYLTFAMAGLALLIILMQDFAFLFIGEKYRSASIFFPFLLWYPVAYTVSETTCIGINISKKTHLNMIISVLTLASGAVFGILLALPLGAAGMAIGTGISGIVMLVLRSALGLRYYNSADRLWRTAVSFALVICASFINYFLHDFAALRLPLVFLCLAILAAVYKTEFIRLAKLSIRLIEDIALKAANKARE